MLFVVLFLLLLKLMRNCTFVLENFDLAMGNRTLDLRTKNNFDIVLIVMMSIVITRMIMIKVNTLLIMTLIMLRIMTS